ncbi:variable large family protein [Borrelia crocidurae]
MVSGTLGIKSDTKKEDIGEYFGKIENTMKAVKLKLGEVLDKNGYYTKVKDKIEEFVKIIDNIELGTKDIAGGIDSAGVVGNAVKNQEATSSEIKSVNSIVRGIKAIVGVVLKDTEGKAEVTKTSEGEKNRLVDCLKMKVMLVRPVAAETSVSIGEVSGADVLKAIARSKENPIVDTEGIEAATDVAGIAVAKKVDNKKEIENETQKDAVIAGGGSIERDGKRW